MQKINTADGLFVDGNQSTGVPGTILTAAWLNMVQAELISVLTAAGITVDGAKFDQLATAIQTLQRGKATVNVAGGVAVTLTAAQYGLPILILTGALTANINLIFPAISGAWIVRNQTSGAFTVTCKTAAGTGVVVSQGFNNALWGDGTNIYTEQSDWLSLALTGTPTTPTAAAGTNTTQVANMAAVQTAVNGKLAKSVAGGATVTLTATEAGYAMLEFTGALTANINVVVPTASAQWIIKNSTTGAYTLTVKTVAGTGVAVTQGSSESLWCDGTNVLEADGGKADKATTLAGYGITIATQGEAEAGTDNTKPMTPLRVAQAIAAKTGGFNSAEQTITAGGLSTIAHGLGVVPTLDLVLICKTAEGGYAVGDEVTVSHQQIGWVTSGAGGFGLSADANNIYLRIGTGMSGVIFRLVNKSTGASFDVTSTNAGNWRVVVRASA